MICFFTNGAYAESIIPARLAQKNLLSLKAGTAFRDGDDRAARVCGARR
jgi:hypothetical protein